MQIDSELSVTVDDIIQAVEMDSVRKCQSCIEKKKKVSRIQNRKLSRLGGLGFDYYF